MTKSINHLLAATLATSIIAVAAMAGTPAAHAEQKSVKLLTAKFDSRAVEKVEVGDFHFLPGQNAPIHTHSAPAVGYVAKGAIIYQIEGEKPQILRKGDVFYEPVGPRILRFDNLSATEEAIFLDFNLEQAGEPFIVFEKKPTEAIDRRTLPTVNLDSKTINRVDIYENELAQNGILKLRNDAPTLGIVAEGVIELRITGKKSQRIAAGASFAVPTATATITNVSSQVVAKVITFLLR